MSEQHPAMRLLQAGIPLTLLLDLAEPDGPDTAGIMAAERSERSLRPAGPRDLVAAGANDGLRWVAEA